MKIRVIQNMTENFTLNKLSCLRTIENILKNFDNGIYDKHTSDKKDLDLFLKYHGIKIADLLLQKKWDNCLHHDHFCKNKQTDIFATQKSPGGTKQQLHWDLCNNVVNDWQHWHLGQTLTWTPLRDLEIFKLMLRLPADEIVEQTMNSKFSTQLIERNCPGLGSALSYSKNSGNVLSNLIKIYE
jgi:hypothetical protein